MRYAISTGEALPEGYEWMRDDSICGGDWLARQERARRADHRGGATRRRGWGEDAEKMLWLPFNYILDESDPDIVILRRRDGCFVAAFSASGATKEGIREAVIEDYLILIKAHAISLTLRTDEEQSERLTQVDDIHRSA